MTNWLRKIMPKEEKFFPLFERHAEEVEKGAKALQAILAECRAGSPETDELARITKAGQDTARDILDGIRGSFVTPFDRADIKEMTSSMQAALDEMGAASRMAGPGKNGRALGDLGQFGELVVECAGELKRGVTLLENVDKHADELRGMRERIAAIRGRMTGMRDDAMLTLFEHGAEDPIGTLSAVKLLERVGGVVERLDSVADHVDDLVLDHV